MAGQHVSVLDKGEYLLVTCSSCHDAEECMACIDGMYDALELFGKSKILADFTATPEPIPIMAPSVHGRLPEWVSERSVQLAIVVRQGAMETRTLLESIAIRNRPVNASVFLDFDAALAWLVD